MAPLVEELVLQTPWCSFLEFFVPNRGFTEEGEKIPWAHLDIAGSAWGPGSRPAQREITPYSSLVPLEYMLGPFTG